MKKPKGRFLAALLFGIAVASTASINVKAVAGDDADVVKKEVAKKAAAIQFEQMLLGTGKDHSIESTQARLQRLLKKRIESVDRVCGLSDAQKRKLDLAGRVAIKQLFERFEEQKQAFVSAERDPQEASKFLYSDPEIAALHGDLRSSPLDDDSLLAKTLRTALTPEQAAKLDLQKALAANSNKKITTANAVELVRYARQPRKVYRICWARDGRQIAFVDFGKQVEVYSTVEDRVVRRFGEQTGIWAFEFGPEENLVAINEKMKDVVLLDLKNGTEIKVATGEGQQSIRFSPDGKLIATGSYGTMAKLWSTSTGELVRELALDSHEGGLTPVFSPDGKTLAVGNRNSTTHLFDVASGRTLHVLNRRMSQGLSFDPTGTTLAVAYVDGSLSLWDVATGKLKRSIQSKADELYSVNWTPDGTVLVTGGNHAQVTLWNSSDLSILCELESPEWTISTTFSPDGTKLVFAGGGGFVGSKGFVDFWAVP
ncbi:MAG: WD repeat-containing protein [Planctomycetota bacterium]|nr:MAG: WD repeat-containing protein [Planctomycetota bacterium]